MSPKSYYLIICFVWISVAGCSTPNHREFNEAFELSSFLRTHIHELQGQRIQFQILTQQGNPVSFGLLRFQWVEGGRMSFQTDPNGVLDVEFEKDILDYEVMVSAESEDAKVRVTW
ncbi:MAG: hypothetical protein OXU27_10145 [Candidatus Poribacteria bacterium]|nr:hypothetical protein [Candidatus Poribacteria bacterium]